MPRRASSRTMDGPAREARDLGRGLVGALLLGLPLAYTMETWWLGWRLPTHVILLFDVVGIAVVVGVTHAIGFKRAHRGPVGVRRLVEDFLELILTSSLAAYGTLLLFGIIDPQDSLAAVVRLGAIELIPFALGAALANHAFAGAEGEGPAPFAKEMAVYALGALFFAFPVAPTEEMALMAAHTGPWRLALVVAVSLALCYVALYELEFRGASGRARRPLVQAGETFTGYAVAFAVSAGLLAGYGQLLDVTLYEGVQKCVILGLLASVGGAAARVIL